MEGAPSQTGQMLRFWEAGEFEYQQHLPQGLSREETREKRKTAHFSEHSGERGVREAQVATRLPPDRRQAFRLCHRAGDRHFGSAILKAGCV